MKYVQVVVLCLVSFVAAVSSASSAFNLKEQLVDKNGKALSGSRTITVEIYDSGEGGTALFKTNLTVKAESDGVFNACIDDDRLMDVFTTDKDRYVAISGGGVPNNRPRQQIMQLPTTIYAQNVSVAEGNFPVWGTLKLMDGLQAGAVTNKTNGDVSVGELDVSGTWKSDSATLAGLEIGGSLTLHQGLAATNIVDIDASEGKLAVKSLDVKDGFILDGVTNAVIVPAGTIVMWYDEKKTGVPPSGWAFCDGNNGTPDLTGRFIVGANTGREDENLGRTGGARKVALTKDQMPKHKHEFFGDDELSKGATSASDKRGYDADSGTGDKKKSNMYYTTETGKSEGHENRPPYYALYYIIKL